MKNIIYILILFLVSSCNTKYNVIDTGIANGYYDGTMYEYFHSNSYDWDSTILMIDRAGLTDLFEGHREGYEKITFFGPTNHSIRLWMLQNNYNSVDKIPTEVCYQMIMRSVVKGVYMRDDIARGKTANDIPGQGGQIMTGGIGNRFWIYSLQEDYYRVPESGAVLLFIESLSSRLKIDIASTNIETQTGIVHSLHYSYQMGTL